MDDVAIYQGRRLRAGMSCWFFEGKGADGINEGRGPCDDQQTSSLQSLGARTLEPGCLGLNVV